MELILRHEKRPPTVVWCPGTELAGSLVLRPDLGLGLERREQARLNRLSIHSRRLGPPSSGPSPERPARKARPKPSLFQD
jgi:hypothetical protein